MGKYKEEIKYRGVKAIIKQKTVFEVGNKIRGFIWGGVGLITLLSAAQGVRIGVNYEHNKKPRLFEQAYQEALRVDNEAFSIFVAEQQILGTLPENFVYEEAREAWINNPSLVEARQTKASEASAVTNPVRTGVLAGAIGAIAGGVVAGIPTYILDGTGKVTDLQDLVQDKLKDRTREYNAKQKQKAHDGIDNNLGKC